MDLTSYKNRLESLLLENKLKISGKNRIKTYIFGKSIFEWNKTINLTGHKNWEDYLEKDVLDHLYLSMYIITYIKNSATLIDIGCGAGFSGIMLGLLYPKLLVTFLDSDRKKINFVKEACRQLELTGHKFENKRVEELKVTKGWDLVISRATWDQEEYISKAYPLIKEGGYLVSMQGKKKSTVNIQKYQDLTLIDEQSYMILPQKFKRNLTIYQKNRFHVKTL